MHRRIILFVLLLVLAGCGEAATVAVAPTPAATELPAPTPTPTCQQLAQVYDDEIKLVLSSWNDAQKIVDASPRMSLATPLATLQTIKRDTAAKIVPSCIEQTHGILLQWMDATIEGYLVFLRNEGQPVVDAQFEVASAWFGIYKSNMNKLVRGELTN